MLSIADARPKSFTQVDFYSNIYIELNYDYSIVFYMDNRVDTNLFSGVGVGVGVGVIGGQGFGKVGC